MLVFGPGGGFVGAGRVEVGFEGQSAGRGGRDVGDVVLGGL